MGSERKIHKTHIEKSFQIREQVCKTSEEGGRIQLPEPVENCQEEGVFHGRGRRRSGWRSSRRVCRGCSLDVLPKPTLNCTVLYYTVLYIVYYRTVFCAVRYIIVQRCKVLHLNSCLHY